MKKITLPLFEKQVIMEPGILVNLIIENKKEYIKFAFSILNQLNNNDDKIITLSEQLSILDSTKYISIITDIFNLSVNDNSSTKTLYKFVDNEIKKDNLSLELHEIINKVIEFIKKTNVFYDFDIDYDLDLSLSSIYKAFNVKILDDTDSSATKLIQYIRYNNEFYGKEIFIICNFKNLFDLDDVNLIIEETSKVGVTIINLDTAYSLRDQIDNETYLVLDEDLCEII